MTRETNVNVWVSIVKLRPSVESLCTENCSNGKSEITSYYKITILKYQNPGHIAGLSMIENYCNNFLLANILQA